MTVRKFGSIKSLLHFDYPYFNEPNDGLGDEVSSEVWTRVGNTKLAGNEIPYDVQGEPKFSYRCAYFPDTTSAIQGTNTSGIFNLSPSGSYEIEAFMRAKDGSVSFSTSYEEINGDFVEVTTCNYSGAGNIFTIGDLTLSVNSSGQLELLSETSTVTITGEWQHILLRLKDGAARVFLDGVKVLSAVLPATLTEPEIITLGGYVGYMDEFCFRHSAGIGTPLIPTQPYSGKLNVNKVGGFGTGADGDVTISASSQINSYGAINAITDAKTFTVSSWNNGTYTPAVGSEVMIHIIGSIKTTNADYPLAGFYAFRKIESLDGTNVILDKEISITNGDNFTLDSSLLSIYYVQVICVPNFASLTTNTKKNIKPLAFSTTKKCGGIVAFRCTGNCTLNSSILTHNNGKSRYDWHQMTHSQLIDRFLCSHGGGIFITCGGTFTVSTDARLGASWSGLGDGSNGAAGYGGKGGNLSPTTLVSINGGNGGVGGGGGGGACSAMNEASFRAAPEANTTEGGAAGGTGGSGYVGGGGGGCSGNGGNATLYVGGIGGGGQGGVYGSNGTSQQPTGNNHISKGTQTKGINGGYGDYWTTAAGNSSPNLFAYYAGAGGGAPGGNGGTGYSCKTGIDVHTWNGGTSGASIILICNKLKCDKVSLSTGGQAGVDASYESSYTRGGGSGGGGTGFCYIACKEQVSA